MNDDLSVFDDIPDEREPTGECRVCGANLYGKPNPDDYDLWPNTCFQCWVRLDKAEAEYVAVFTHGGTR